MGMKVRAAAPLDAEAVLPMTLLLEHLKVDDQNEEPLTIEAARLASLDWIERYVGMSLSSRSWIATFDAPISEIRLPMGPVISIDAFTYLDQFDVLQTWPATSYRLSGDEVFHRTGLSWAAAFGRMSVSIEYFAGFEDIVSEAPALRAAALMLAGHFYRNREENAATVLSAIPFGVEMICDPIRQPVMR